MSSDSLLVTNRAGQSEHEITGDPRAISAAIRCLLLADGQTTMDEVREMAGLTQTQDEIAETQDEVTEVLEFLTDERLLVDIRRCPEYAAFLVAQLNQPTEETMAKVYGAERWVDSRTGPQQGHNLADDNLQRARSFVVEDLDRRAAGLSPPQSAVQGLLNASYGPSSQGSRAVPSAGGLWPLTLHTLSSDPSADRSLALSWFDDRSGRVAWCKKAVDLDAVRSCLVQSPVVQRSVELGATIVIISADLTRVGLKYGSRGTQFSLIEAGAVMQRCYEKSGESGLLIRAVGGFRVAGIRRLLDVEPTPLLALLLIDGPRR